MRIGRSVFVFSLVLGACHEETPEPGLVSVSREYCSTFKMCDPTNFSVWKDLEECEAYSASEYESAMKSDGSCFDARLAWEACVGALESCQEYERCLQGKQCVEESLAFIKYCDFL